MKYPLISLLVTLTLSDIEFPPKDWGAFENLSVELLKAKDPDAPVAEMPDRVAPEKSLLESANADNDIASRISEETLANFKDRIMTLHQPYKSTAPASLYSSSELSRLRILATSCKPLQHLL
jgi:hypothetical protein